MKQVHIAWLLLLALAVALLCYAFLVTGEQVSDFDVKAWKAASRYDGQRYDMQNGAISLLKKRGASTKGEVIELLGDPDVASAQHCKLKYMLGAKKMWGVATGVYYLEVLCSTEGDGVQCFVRPE